MIILAALAAVLSLPSKTLALTQVPILWCALKGTDLALASVADRNMALWRLHELPSDFVFIPLANVTLRSELVWDLKQAANFKVIDDPDTSGTEGDIANNDEGQKAQAACRQAYENDANINKVALQGITALYVRRLLHVRPASDTSTNSAYGYGLNGIPTGDQCSNPPTVSKWVDASLYIEETVRNSTGGANPNQSGAVTFLAHEFGHSLSLRHGDGKEEPSDVDPKNIVDDDGLGGCGAGEKLNTFVCKTPETIMNASASDCASTFTDEQKRTTFMTPEQIAQLKKVAQAVPGCKDPTPGSPCSIQPFVTKPVVSDYRSDRRDEVPLRGVDLVAQIVAQDPATTSFIHRLNGLLPPDDLDRLGLSYTVFIDLDGAASTGGSPSDLSFDTDFAGAELVAEVEFARVPPIGDVFDVVLRANVWKFQGGSFMSVTDPRIAPSVQSAVNSETGVAAYDTVQISIPDDIIGPIATPLRLQAIAEYLAVIDRLPDDRAGSVDFWLVPARYPECDVAPASVAQGRQATVTATFPLANTPVHVVLGADQVEEGMTDGAGVAVVPFTIPTEAQTGPRLVTVGMGATALTADCTVMVEQAPPNTAPDCSGATASPDTLWPPNQQLVDVSVQGVTDTDGDPVTIKVTSIRQDEPLKGGGSGNTCPDGQGVGTSSASVRTERAGTGDGRVYHVSFTADDGRGGTCPDSVTVCVPHDQSVAPICVDGGALVDSTGPCR